MDSIPMRTNFNTLAAYEALMSTGFSDTQAKHLVQTLVDSQYDRAIKQDILEVKSELKTEISGLRTELKTEISDLRTEMKKEISDVKSEVKDLAWQTKGIIAMQALTMTGLGFLLAKLTFSS